MAESSGAIQQWRSLPFPVRLAAIFLAGMAVIWLTRWLGGISVLVALLLWCAVGVGLLHAAGRLAWVDRYSAATRILESFAPRFTTAVPTATQENLSALPKRGDAGEPPAMAPPSGVDLSRFVGLDRVLGDIDELVAARAGGIAPVAPATLVLLVGPRGVGKSSVARALLAKLHRAGALASDRIVAVGPTEMRGLDDGHGPSRDGLGIIGRIRAALDGVLLIDDVDWLVATSGGHAADGLGNGLLAVARGYPGRLFVIGAGSAAAVSRLDPANRWLGQLNVRRIDFPPLAAAALQNIFERLLAEKGLRLAAGAERAVQIQIEERRTQGGEEFDNAHAIRRLVDDVLHRHGLRAHGAPAPAIVTAEDVRNARSSL